MQRDFTRNLLSSNATMRGERSTSRPPKTRNNALLFAVMTAGLLSLSGCQTIKNLTGNDDGEDAVATADKSYSKYYEDAMEALEKGNYLYAAEQLSELRVFYPTGAYAEDALLNLMYAQFQGKEYEAAALSAEQFIKLYPRNIQVDYAYYVRGVSNMQSGSSALLHLAKINQAHRDTAYLRLAFSNFQDLISRYPNSKYAPDAAKRMSYIYNQFAEKELTVARWYIKRDAYVAAANRAKWVFQYYPLSEQVPEAIAILAFSHEQLGLNDLAQDYKTLLQINYPNWLTNDGRVKLDTNRSSGLLNTLTLGKLGKADKSDQANDNVVGSYNGATKTQIIENAMALQLPQEDIVASQNSLASLTTTNNTGFNIGLGLPENSTQLTDQTNPQTPVNPITRSPASTPVNPPIDSANINDEDTVLEDEATVPTPPNTLN